MPKLNPTPPLHHRPAGPTADRHPGRLAGARLLPTLLVATAALSAAGLTAPATAQADDRTRADRGEAEDAVDFNLPAQPLGQALNALAQQAGAQVLFAAELAQGRTAPPLQGRFSIEQGLHRLLAGSGLEARRSGNAWQIQRAAGAAAEAGALPEVVVKAAATNDGTTEGSNSYTAQAVTAGSKTALSLKENPRSISIITREQLDDQHITTFTEAMERLPGVTVSIGGGDAHAAPSYYTRGYSITSVNVDGSPLTNMAASHGMAGMAKYDNVQLLRGPDGLLSGNGEPGGVINLVRKKATRDRQVLFTASAGRWDNYLGELDVSGPLVADGRIRGRAVLSYNDREYFFKGADRRLSTWFATLGADLTPDTELSIGASQDRNQGSGLDGAPPMPRYTNGDVIDIPRDYGYGRWAYYNKKNKEVFASLNHRFNDDWKLTVNASKADFTLESVASYLTGAADAETGLGTKMSAGVFGDVYGKAHSLDAFVSGEFGAWGRSHQLAVGANRQVIRSGWAGTSGTASLVDIVDWSNLDADALFPDEPATQKNGAPYWAERTRTTQTALYGTGNLQVTDALHVLLGGRYSSFKRDSDVSSAWAGELVYGRQKTSGTFTPYYGLMYEVSERWSAYATVVHSFEDQSNYVNAARQPLDPTRGRSIEVGLKGEHFNGRLNTSFALYRTERNDYRVRTADDQTFPQSGLSCCYVGDGKFVSQGIELEVSGEILPRWQVNAGYTFDDNETRYGDGSGQRYASYTPRHMLRLWTRVDAGHGFALGGGVSAQSSSFRSGTVNTWDPEGGLDGSGGWDGPSVPFQFHSSGRAVWSAFSEYRFNPTWLLSLNINNLFDKRYYARVDTTSYGNVYGEPRSWVLTLRGRF